MACGGHPMSVGLDAVEPPAVVEDRLEPAGAHRLADLMHRRDRRLDVEVRARYGGSVVERGAVGPTQVDTADHGVDPRSPGPTARSGDREWTRRVSPGPGLRSSLPTHDAPMPRALATLTRAAACLAAVLTLSAALLAGAPSSTALDRSDTAGRGLYTGPDKLANAAKPTIQAANRGKRASTSTAVFAEMTKLLTKHKAGASFSTPACNYSGPAVICRSSMKNRTTGRSMGTARLTVTGDGSGKVTKVTFS